MSRADKYMASLCGWFCAGPLILMPLDLLVLHGTTLLMVWVFGVAVICAFEIGRLSKLP